jgi:hypothetical protein
MFAGCASIKRQAEESVSSASNNATDVPAHRCVQLNAPKRLCPTYLDVPVNDLLAV